MKYMGSKNRHAKELLPIILKDRKEGQCYVEPFVGGANMIDKVAGWRIGCDSHEYLIPALKMIRDDPYKIPEVITESMYEDAKHNMYADDLKGFIGFAMSFGGKWFGGYRRDVAGTKGCTENMETQTRRSRDNAIKQSVMLKGVDFRVCDYMNLAPPSQSIIYCDPPYQSSTGYKDKFDHKEFWQWCRDMSNKGHDVFISEYSAPDDFVCIWEKKVNSSLTKDTGAKKNIERLFRHKSQVAYSLCL